MVVCSLLIPQGLSKPVARQKLRAEVGSLVTDTLAAEEVRQGAAIAVKDVVWRCSWPAASVVSAVTAVVVVACMQTPK